MGKMRENFEKFELKYNAVKNLKKGFEKKNVKQTSDKDDEAPEGKANIVRFWLKASAIGKPGEATIAREPAQKRARTDADTIPNKVK